MALTINLYNNYSDPTVVHKKMTLVKSAVTCEITDSVDVDEMDLLFDMDSAVNTCNYAYIAAFGRYYFLTPGIVNGNQMILHALSDPLMSFWSSFSGSECIAERSSSHPNPELVDDLLPFKPQPQIIRRKMPTGFTPSSSGGSYILTVGGK